MLLLLREELLRLERTDEGLVLLLDDEEEVTEPLVVDLEVGVADLKPDEERLLLREEELLIPDEELPLRMLPSRRVDEVRLSESLPPT